MLKDEIYKILYDKFNLVQFRPLQEDIISSILAKRNTLGILQTGYGKSLTYQLPSQILPGLTIVISPLISLMQDQVKELRKRDIETGSINSMTEDFEKHTILKNIYEGETKIIFLSPEKLIEQKFLDYIISKGVEVSLIVVDEAHCISQWGNQFRPSYQALEKLKFDYNEIPVLLLTGTATKQIRNEIKDRFIVEDKDTFVGSFLKKNLDYEIIFKDKEPKKQTFGIIEKHAGEKGIVYCNTRKEVEEVTSYLKEHDISAEMYHAGMENADREGIQTRYGTDDLDVIVATTAFGMGINVPNIRFVIHYNTPYSVENYYQETGRAGRDGRNSNCYLLFSPKDVAKTKFFLMQDEGEPHALSRFDAMIRFVMSSKCRKKTLIRYFDEVPNFENCGKCDICKREAESLKIENSKEIVKTIVETIIQDCNGERSIGTVRDILLGSKSKKIKEAFSDAKHYGIFKGKYKKEMVEYFIYSLIVDDVLKSETRNAETYSWEVLYVNPDSNFGHDYEINQPIFDF